MGQAREFRASFVCAKITVSIRFGLYTAYRCLP